MKVIASIFAFSACFILCYLLFGPFIKFELYILKRVYDFGSGYDDGVHEIVVSNKIRYKDTILEMLHESTPGSFNAEASFIFGDMLRDDPDVNKSVMELSENHSDRSIRCFWHDVVNDRYEKQEIILDDEFSSQMFEIIDTGSTCP